MNEVVTLETIAAEAHKADQMGRQTVEQLAKVGQMIVEYRAVNPTMADLSRVINATGYQQAHIYRLEKLAKHWPQIEQKHPESLRGALLLIEQGKPRATPAPMPAMPQATPQQQSQLDKDAAYIKSEIALADSLEKQVAAMEEAILDLEDQIEDHRYNAGKRLLAVKEAFDEAEAEASA